MAIIYRENPSNLQPFEITPMTEEPTIALKFVLIYYCRNCTQNARAPTLILGPGRKICDYQTNLITFNRAGNTSLLAEGGLKF